jgi:hypothetical protein
MNEQFTRAGQFPDTPWTQIRLAGGGDTRARASFAALCRMYWAPLYGFARRGGMSPEESEDVTQSFFVHLMQDLEMAARGEHGEARRPLGARGLRYERGGGRLRAKCGRFVTGCLL